MKLLNYYFFNSCDHCRDYIMVQAYSREEAEIIRDYYFLTEKVCDSYSICCDEEGINKNKMEKTTCRIILTRQQGPFLVIEDRILDYPNNEYPVALEYTVKPQWSVHPFYLYAEVSTFHELIVESSPFPVRDFSHDEAYFIHRMDESILEDARLEPVITEMKQRFILELHDKPYSFTPMYQKASYFILSEKSGKICISTTGNSMMFLFLERDLLQCSIRKLSPEIELLTDYEEFDKCKKIYDILVLGNNSNNYFNERWKGSADELRKQIADNSLQKLFDNSLELLCAEEEFGIFHYPL